MNCKYLSKKLNGHLYCKLKKEEIQESCFNCHLREFSKKGIIGLLDLKTTHRAHRTKPHSLLNREHLNKLN